jgi:hypothetical protein
LNVTSATLEASRSLRSPPVRYGSNGEMDPTVAIGAEFKKAVWPSQPPQVLFF